jgi:carbonic anhydrase
VNPLDDLLARNRAWASARKAADPEFFARLAGQQRPRYMWIGCSDSRVPANEIVDLDPGTIFVHRNVAGVVVHTDLNCLSVLQFAVDVLEIEHVIVCGHQGCAGVRAAFERSSHGLVDNWLRHVRDVYQHNREEIDALPDDESRLRRLCELNVVQQVANVGSTTIVQDAWHRGRPLAVHGLVYDLADGLLRDLRVSVATPIDLERLHRVGLPPPVGRGGGEAREPGDPAQADRARMRLE